MCASKESSFTCALSRMPINASSLSRLQTSHAQCGCIKKCLLSSAHLTCCSTRQLHKLRLLCTRRTSDVVKCAQLPDDLTCRRTALVSLTGIFGLCCFHSPADAAEDPQTQLSKSIGILCISVHVHVSGKQADIIRSCGVLIMSEEAKNCGFDTVVHLSCIFRFSKSQPSCATGRALLQGPVRFLRDRQRSNAGQFILSPIKVIPCRFPNVWNV